jgi:prepilin-type N-terminal cleavage/methylation domain-containing protein
MKYFQMKLRQWPPVRSGRPRVVSRGITLLELIVVVALLAIIAAVGLPNFFDFLRRSRARGAADSIAVAARDARSRSLQSGWQFRVFGLGDASAVFRNRYRIEGRMNAGAGWPAVGTGMPVFTATQSADAVVDLNADFGGTRINVNDGLGTAQCGAASSFCIEFDPQGTYNSASSYLGPGNQVQVMDPSGNTNARVTVTGAGAVRVQR